MFGVSRALGIWADELGYALSLVYLAAPSMTAGSVLSMTVVLINRREAATSFQEPGRPAKAAGSLRGDISTCPPQTTMASVAGHVDACYTCSALC